VAVYAVAGIWGRQDVARRRGRFFRQFCQQGLPLLEVGSIKALGEPAVDWREQGVGGLGLALLLPQPREAQRRPQLPGFGLLAASKAQGLLEASVRLERIRDGLPQP